jgi:hypothetical protein
MLAVSIILSRFSLREWVEKLKSLALWSWNLVDPLRPSSFLIIVFQAKNMYFLVKICYLIGLLIPMGNCTTLTQRNRNRIPRRFSGRRILTYSPYLEWQSQYNESTRIDVPPVSLHTESMRNFHYALTKQNYNKKFIPHLSMVLCSMHYVGWLADAKNLTFAYIWKK